MENLQALKELAEIFNQNNFELFLVGGFVRDSLLNIKSYDMDICGQATSEEVKAILKNTTFVYDDASAKYGTLIIRNKKVPSFKTEYTTFRKDSYVNDGTHTPSNVEFTKDIFTDSCRRDFTVNALYKNVITDEVLDFHNGLKDLKRKTLKTIKSPNETFKEDALRILRLIRQSLALNFKIEKQTMKGAKQNINLVKNLSIERVISEISRLFENDNIETKAIKLLNKIKFSQTFFGFKLNCYKKTSKKHLTITKLQLLFVNGKNTNQKLLDIICCSNDEKKQIHKFFNLLTDVENGNINAIKTTLVLNYSLLNDIKFFIKDKEKNKQLDILIKEIKVNNYPTSLKSLAVTGTDLLKLNIKDKEIGKWLDEIYILIINDKIKNDKTEIINYVKEKNYDSSNNNINN